MSIKLLRRSFLVFAFIIQAASRTANAQGTVLLSHLGSSDDSGSGVGSDAMWAIYFETGTAASGYNLDSIQLRIAGAIGNPSGFEVSLYNNNGGVPGTSLELLSGSIPTSAGVYSFLASDITLVPSTVYWTVVSSPDLLSSGNTVFWGFDPNTYTSSDGWSLGGNFGFNGSSWFDAGGSPFTLAVTASAAPEPEFYSLIGLGLFAIFLQRRK